jgi:hypothetical protein
MNETSEYLTKFIKEKIKNVNTEPFNDNHTFVKIIQNDILIANEEWNRIKSNYSYTFDKDDTLLSKGSMYGHIPAKIRDSIEKNHFLKKTFEFKYLDTTNKKTTSSIIKVYLHDFYIPGRSDNELRIKKLRNVTKENEEYFFLQKYMQKIYIWFYIANKYKLKSCSKIINLHLYLTDSPKQIEIMLPNKGWFYNKNELDTENINTGFTYACLPTSETNEIYVFRKEEWFKVLVHETIHSFGMEFSISSELEDYANKKIAKIFLLPLHEDVLISQKYNIFESYTETIAEIVNVLIYKFLHGGNLKSIFKTEQLFSCFQFAKIYLLQSQREGKTVHDRDSSETIHFSTLHFEKMKFTREDIFRTFDNYEEKTNVFSYYILKSIILFHVNDFMNWIMKNNMHILNFNKTKKNIISYCNFIEKKSASLHYMNSIVKILNVIVLPCYPLSKGKTRKKNRNHTPCNFTISKRNLKLEKDIFSGKKLTRIKGFAGEKRWRRPIFRSLRRKIEYKTMRMTVIE